MVSKESRTIVAKSIFVFVNPLAFIQWRKVVQVRPSVSVKVCTSIAVTPTFTILVGTIIYNAVTSIGSVVTISVNIVCPQLFFILNSEILSHHFVVDEFIFIDSTVHINHNLTRINSRCSSRINKCRRGSLKDQLAICRVCAHGCRIDFFHHRTARIDQF